MCARLLAERAHHPDPRQRLLQIAGDRARSSPASAGRRRPRRSGTPVPPSARIGSARNVSSARWKSSTSRITTTPISVSPDWIRVARPSSTSWSSASTSLVSRRDDHARAVARVEADRQRLQVREQLQPQVLERALADPADQVGLRVGGDPRRPPPTPGTRPRSGRARRRRGGWMPSSMASLASGAGASAAAVAAHQRRRTSPAPASGTARAARRGRAACAPRPPVSRRRRRSSARLALTGPPPPPRRLAGEEHLVGHALLDDLAVQVGLSSSSSCVPCAAIRPSSSTTISSASAIVDSRWAITNVVRPAMQLARARA